MGEWTWRGFKLVQSLVERLPRAWAYALAVMAAQYASYGAYAAQT